MTRIAALLGVCGAGVLGLGCAPAMTECRSAVAIRTGQAAEESPHADTGDRFIVVSFWDDPTVNDSVGELALQDVILTEGRELSIQFPLRTYWVVWTPALGAQHLAPRPGILVFHKDYPACWEIGDCRGGVCCGKPDHSHAFTIVMSTDGSRFPEHVAQPFIAKLSGRRDEIIRMMNRHSELTTVDKAMVTEKLDQLLGTNRITASVDD